jgi:hypothetical protein
MGASIAAHQPPAQAPPAKASARLGVRIDSGPITADLRLDQVPQDQSFTLMQVRASFLAVHLPYDCRQLLEFVEDAEVMADPLGFVGAEDFIRRGLELDPEQVQWAIEGLRRLKPDEPVTFERAQRYGKLDAKTPDLLEAHRPKKLGNEKTVTKVIAAERNDASALARLRRDRPDIHARVLAGELSPHAGMIEAGFRKKPERRKLSAFERITQLIPELSGVELAQLVQLVRVAQLERDEACRRELMEGDANE